MPTGPPERAGCHCTSGGRRPIVGSMHSPTASPGRCRDTAPSSKRDIKRVLLATDLSTASQSATEEAIAIAQREHAHLVVLNVIDPRLLRLPGGRFLRRIDQERADVEASIQAVVARARTLGVRATFLVWQGDPPEAILEAANAEDVDLIVMGSHGRGRLGRLLLGSTSERVNHECPRDVLVIQS
jgi:nucleotide-binding universal stress UspA family protein